MWLAPLKVQVCHNIQLHDTHLTLQALSIVVVSLAHWKQQTMHTIQCW